MERFAFVVTGRKREQPYDSHRTPVLRVGVQESPYMFSTEFYLHASVQLKLIMLGMQHAPSLKFHLGGFGFRVWGCYRRVVSPARLNLS